MRGSGVALLRAMELMRAEVHDPAVREYAVVCYASWLWRQGDVDEAARAAVAPRGAAGERPSSADSRPGARARNAARGGAPVG